MSVRSAGATKRVRVWDIPTRLSHWLFVLLFCVSWWSARHDQLDVHRYSGYALLGTLLFRLYWGLVGTSTARFAQFVRGPRVVWRYLRGNFDHTAPGHTPLGALSVTALLGLLLTQVVLGLFSVDVDGMESGPMSRFVSFEAGRACANAHHWVFNGLLMLVALHIGAIIYYRLVKRRDLVGPMISGWQRHKHLSAQSALGVPRWRTAVGLLIAAAVVLIVARQ
jgi:cytochrome b